jgi:hypothetical protein
MTAGIQPVCWRLLFVFWRARRGKRMPLNSQITDPSLLRDRLPHSCSRDDDGGAFRGFGKSLPTWLFDAFNPNDKTNLAPYRVLHFVVMVFVVTRFVSKDWRGLEWQIFKPIILCGQQSLAAFASGSSSHLSAISY